MLLRDLSMTIGALCHIQLRPILSSKPWHSGPEEKNANIQTMDELTLDMKIPLVQDSVPKK